MTMALDTKVMRRQVAWRDATAEADVMLFNTILLTTQTLSLAHSMLAAIPSP
jgi:hypothetical protein